MDKSEQMLKISREISKSARRHLGMRADDNVDTIRRAVKNTFQNLEDSSHIAGGTEFKILRFEDIPEEEQKQVLRAREIVTPISGKKVDDEEVVQALKEVREVCPKYSAWIYEYEWDAPEEELAGLKVQCTYDGSVNWVEYLDGIQDLPGAFRRCVLAVDPHDVILVDAFINLLYPTQYVHIDAVIEEEKS